ncbi:MAG TPA: glycosyl hydrolase family 8 [Polyangiaceae bacterium]
MSYSNFLFARAWLPILASIAALSGCEALKADTGSDDGDDSGASNSGASGTGNTGQGGSAITGGAFSGGTSGTGAASGGSAAVGQGGSNGGTGTGGAGPQGGTSAGGTFPNGGSGAAPQGGSGGAAPVPGPPYRFPQGYRSTRCTYPTGANYELARTAYNRWKTELVTSEGAGGFLRVRRPANEGDTTVSEGIGYGMIFAVVMDDQAMFDAFWKYSQLHLNQNGLMNWKVNPDGQVPMDGMGAATDADEDMAWALILADKKWGGGGTLGMPYLDVAKSQIDKIWNHEVDHGRGELLVAGDSWGATVAHNPSYFAPNQYRRFGIVTGKVAEWNRVIEKNYAMLASTLTTALGNASNGLVPAWTDDAGRPASPFMGAPQHYQYDSARMPFRIAQDWCDYGDERAKAYLDKTTSFFSGIGASMIVDGYNLDGMARPENPLPAQSALFVGGAGVGAMSSAGHQAFVNDVYGLLTTKDMFPPSYYFNMCWQVFSLLMMTGNLYDYHLVP